MSGALARQLALRGLAGAAAMALLWRAFGPFGLVFAAPLVGALLARPLIELAAELKQGTQALALAAIEGNHYEFRGHPLRVVDDDDGLRWLAAADLRRVVPGLPADASLARLVPADGLRKLGTPPALHLQAEAVIALLARAQEPVTLKFVHWIEREVAGPARRRRETRTADFP